MQVNVKIKPERPQRGSQGRFQNALPRFGAKLKGQCDAMIIMLKTTKITIDHCWESTQVAGRVPRTTALTLGVQQI